MSLTSFIKPDSCAVSYELVHLSKITVCTNQHRHSNLVDWENDVSDDNFKRPQTSLKAPPQFLFTLRCSELGTNSTAYKKYALRLLFHERLWRVLADHWFKWSCLHTAARLVTDKLGCSTNDHGKWGLNDQTSRVTAFKLTSWPGPDCSEFCVFFVWALQGE
jgi:hypothetical protein